MRDGFGAFPQKDMSVPSHAHAIAGLHEPNEGGGRQKGVAEQPTVATKRHAVPLGQIAPFVQLITDASMPVPVGVGEQLTPSAQSALATAVRRPHLLIDES